MSLQPKARQCAKFKKEKKRLPNKEEAAQIADNLFNQLKDEKQVVGSESVGRERRGRTKEPGEGMAKEDNTPRQRGRRRRGKEEPKVVQKNEEIEGNAPKKNIKDLFGSSGTGIEDDFKIDLGHSPAAVAE